MGFTLRIPRPPASGARDGADSDADTDADAGLLPRPTPDRVPPSKPTRAPRPSARWIRRLVLLASVACLGVLFLGLYVRETHRTPPQWAPQWAQDAMVPAPPPPPPPPPKPHWGIATSVLGPTYDELEPEWRWAANVSLVYTWVNGSDPAWRGVRKEYNSRVGGNRDRDNEDMRFSLRSVERLMPWHRGKIYVVSPSSPTWANTTATGGRIEWIDQNRLVPSEDQPTFNSNVIEQVLHLIPGLTEHYIHINDDYLIVRPVHPRVFFTEDHGIKLFIEPKAVNPPKGDFARSMMYTLWQKSVYTSVRAVQERYRDLPGGPPEVHFVKHAPFVYTRTLMQKVHDSFTPLLDGTRKHRNRNSKDGVTPFLFHGVAMAESKTCCNQTSWVMPADEGKSFALLAKWRSDPMENTRTRSNVHMALKNNLTFLTVNDEMGVHEMLVRPLARELRRFYEELIGTIPSSHELDHFQPLPNYNY